MPQKDMRGSWKEESVFTIPNRPGFRLFVYTHKVSSGALVTTARVDALSERGLSSHRMSRDFNRTLAQSVVRCTEKNVQEQHTHALKQVDSLHADIEAHYAQKGW